MAITQEQFETLKSVAELVRTVEVQSMQWSRLMDRVLKRADPNEPLNADVVWTELLATYVPIYNAAKQETIDAVALTPDPTPP